MLKTTEDFENGNTAECYEHFVMAVDSTNYFKMPRTLLHAIYETAFDISISSFNQKGKAYLLYGHTLITCSDPYDKIVPIAISDNFEELMVFANLHGISLNLAITKNLNFDIISSS